MDNKNQTIIGNSTVIIIFKAVLGAILGAIPSMFLWIVLGKAGYVAAISGFFMMMGELIACDHFTKKYNDMNFPAAVIICAVVMIADVYICERFIWSWELTDIFNEYNENGVYISFFDCFKDFNNIAANMGIREDFDASLIKSYLFALIGAVAGCYKLAKK